MFRETQLLHLWEKTGPMDTALRKNGKHCRAISECADALADLDLHWSLN